MSNSNIGKFYVISDNGTNNLNGLCYKIIDKVLYKRYEEHVSPFSFWNEKNKKWELFCDENYNSSIEQYSYHADSYHALFPKVYYEYEEEIYCAENIENGYNRLCIFNKNNFSYERIFENNISVINIYGIYNNKLYFFAIDETDSFGIYSYNLNTNELKYEYNPNLLEMFSKYCMLNENLSCSATYNKYHYYTESGVLYKFDFDNFIEENVVDFSEYSNNNCSMCIVNDNIYIVPNEDVTCRFVYNITTMRLNIIHDVYKKTYDDYTYDDYGYLINTNTTLLLYPTDEKHIHLISYDVNGIYEGFSERHYIIDLNYSEDTSPSVDNPTDKIFYITNEGDGYFYGNIYAKDGIFKGTVYAEDGYFKGDVYANSITLGEDAVVSGNISATTGNIGGFTINETSISAVNTTNNTGITLNSNGDITSYGANQWMWLNGGNLYFGIGKQVDFSKAHSFISSNGIYVASNAAINSTDGITNYLLVADTNTDQVMISTHTDAKSALCIYNDSNTDTSNLDGEASGITIKTDYAGFSNRPLDIITKTGNDDGSQNYIYMNVFGQYEGSGDGSSFDEYGRLTLRSAINTGTEWIGNDASLSNGYIPSSIGSTTFRWGQGFFHDLTTTNSVKEVSDRKLKEHIEYLDSKESLEFINRLQPAEYTMICSENKRVHRGFYAQEVSKTAHELDCRDLSLYSAYVEKDGNISPYDENEDDENLRWSLSYNEFIAPMVSAMQGLSRKIDVLEEEIKELKGETYAE